MIYLCCYVSSLRPSDVGSTVTNCSCTLLIGHMEPKSVYTIVITLCMMVSYADNICKGQIRPDVGLSGHYNGIPKTVI